MNPPAPGALTLADALARARAQGLDRLDAQLLLGHVLQRPRAWLIAHDDEPLADDAARAFDALCRRRAGGEPLAYLVGRREFHGLDLAVGPGVLVPRPDTELLVDWALELLAGPLADRPAPRVLDLGTGSGAIALALARACPRAQVLATDRSADALRQAADNAARLGLPVALAAGDWWQAVPADARFDLVLSNPPYIAAGDPHLAALVHEPIDALTPGGDGLGALRRIVADAAAPPRLAAGGWLLLEHGWDQSDAVAALLRAAGFDRIQARRDLQGHLRCTGARQPDGPGGNTR